MRLLYRLLVVLVVCLVSVAWPAAPAQASGPYITLSPPSGVPGTEVTVRGYNFTTDEGFDIYYYRSTARVLVLEVDTDEDGYFKDTFIVPESYTGTHDVRAYRGTNLQATEHFTVEPGLTVSPEDAPVGTNVTVEGHGFAEDEAGIEVRYYLDGTYTTIATNIEANAYGSWQKSFAVPPSAQGDHRIDAKGDDSSFYQVQDATFEVTPAISIIDQASGSPIEEPSGSPGENITMTGNGFYPNDSYIKILFGVGATQAQTGIIRADDDGYWQGNFTVPETPKGTYSVTAEGESTPKEDVGALSFAVKPGLVLSPSNGYVGMNLTVTGRGFAANKDVDIKYEDNQEATARTNAKGSFETSFIVPESQHGVRTVAAEDAAGNNAAANFTMESVPPDTPELNSPPDGSRVGFIGKVRPTFEWSAVPPDPSGVYYSLEIATSANVTTGGFVNPIVSVEGLVGTNYTLNATKALPYGTYYWIVQAVDGAENAGNWTAARSFHAGLLPLWAFIVIIVVIVGLIGALVYFFVIRRRIHYY
jgi:hypothetical protein